MKNSSPIANGATIFSPTSTGGIMSKLPIANFQLPIVIGCLFANLGFAQESPTPSPIESASPPPTPTAPVAVRSVPLRFVPPPMEGTISLGIWDSNDKLVRVVHFEDKIDKFTVEENSLSTTWDGKDNLGNDLPPGKYRARGYLVGKLKIEDAGKVAAAPDTASDHISVKLVVNPLVADTRSTMDVGVSFGPNGVFLRTMDDLPLATITESLTPTRVLISKDGEKTADVWQVEESNTEHLRVSNIDKMMAFDCGFFQLK
jgi:hypothetical protein